MKLLLTVAALTLASPLAHAANCQKVLQLHGFKAAAQASCGFGQVQNEAIQWEKACARQQTANLNEQQIGIGNAVFRITEMKMGHAEACQDVFSKFAGIFTPR